MNKYKYSAVSQVSKQWVAVLWSGGSVFPAVRSGFGSSVKSRQTTDNDKMARVCFLAFIAGLLLDVYALAAEIPEEKTGK